MAQYCTKEMVAVDARVTSFSTSTLPTALDVERMIKEVDAEINSCVGQRYALPITDTSDKLLLQGISIALTAERVRGVTEVATGDNKVAQGVGKASAGDIARGKLKAIIEGKLKLLGSSAASSGDGVKASGRLSTDCVFQRGVDQW